MGKDLDAVRHDLIGTWFRSFEEETGGELVFRGPDHPFPPARKPRPALRLDGDGVATALRGGAGDRLEPQAGAGRWSVHEGVLSLRTPLLSGDFTLLTLAPGRLVVRPPGQGPSAPG